MSVSEDGRIRELAELIRARCAHAQQMRQTLHPAASGVQFSQGDETRRKLKEAMVYLQEEVRDMSVTGVQQRLQYSAQKLSLSCDLQRTSGHSMSCFLSCEAFYVEVSMEENGYVQSVKLAQGTQQEESTTLAALLRQYKYSSFDSHLKALMEVYSQAPSQDREKLIQVLSATEQVLLSMHNGRSGHSSLYECLMLDPLGVVTPRDAGLPLKMTFFVLPNDIVRHSNLFSPCTHVDLGQEPLGVSAEVLVERSAQMYRLSVDPNLFDSAQGKFRPPQSTVAVPLTLVMVVSVKLPLCAAVMSKLHQAVYGADQNVQSLAGPHIDQLLLMERGLGVEWQQHAVYLPGEVHRFNITSPPNPAPHCRGLLLPNSKVPFLHPAQVPSIIILLRQQLLYNVMLGSCFSRSTRGQGGKGECGEEIQWSVSTSPPEWISVRTELLSAGSPSLSVKFLTGGDSTLPLRVQVCLGVGEGEFTTALAKVASRCLSIPVTVHAALCQPTLLGPSVAAAVTEHRQLLKQFEAELTHCTLKAVDYGLPLQESSAGVKRQRMDT